MSFISLEFWGFFAAVLGLYVVLPHKGQNRMLLVASYVFYGAWDWRFLGLILASTIVDYLVGLKMSAAADDHRRRRLLSISLAFNLGMLGIFKYFGFFADSFATLAAGFGWDPGALTLNIVLPVGISFYTFQTLSYTIDIHRRRLEPTRDFFDFALFVAFFPQLVAGPIERATNLLPNITNPRTLSWNAARAGTVLCLIGLIKKVVIADGVAPSVNAIYGAPDPGSLDILLATWLFALQIYGDFSGYTDIARGVAMILGFQLMRNFAQPYFATNPQDFWHRWHISLSTWLRDYLYISLGGNRGGQMATYRNLILTMVLGGLWHGAAWNFVLWGAWQGGILAIHRAIFSGRASVEVPRQTALTLMKRLLAIGVFFQVTCFGWMLFRARSWDQIVDFTGKLFSFDLFTQANLAIPEPPFAALLGILFLLVWDLLTERSDRPDFYTRWPIWLRSALYAGMIYLLAFGAKTGSSEFIYFQF